MTKPGNESAMLAHLTAQADARGADLATLRALIEEASELGATRALAGIGLDDIDAGKDVEDLRELLSAWRDAKRSAAKAAIGWMVKIALALLLIGLAVKLGLGDMVTQ